MTLKEFDKIRKFLPDTVEIDIRGEAQETPSEGEDWAVYTCSWGNHDGRFNVLCHACGWTTKDIPADLRGDMERTYVGKPCPKCGKTFYKKGTGTL